MNDVAWRRVLTRAEATDLIGTKVGELPATITGETYARDAETGELVLAYVPLGPVADLRRAVLNIRMNHTLRSSGIDNRSKTFGYRARKPQMSRESCGLSQLAARQPNEHAVLHAWAEKLSATYAAFAGDQAAADAETMEKVEPEWKMGPHWTSGVVNRSSCLPYHRDTNNFPTWSAMPVLRRGMAGGYLSVPEFDAVIACRDGWAVIFPGYRYVHGVTPMRTTKPDGYRYSIVFYAQHGMKDCHTTALETERARHVRTQRERAMAERIAAGDTTVPGRRA